MIFCCFFNENLVKHGLIVVDLIVCGGFFVVFFFTIATFAAESDGKLDRA